MGRFSRMGSGEHLLNIHDRGDVGVFQHISLDATPVVLKCRLEAVEVLEVNVSHGGIGGRTASVAEEALATSIRRALFRSGK